MFTDNYSNYKKLRFSGYYSNDATTVVAPDGVSTTVYNQLTYCSDIGYWLTKPRCRVITPRTTGSYPAENYIYPGVYFGSGSSSTTASDYTLEVPITSGLTITSDTLSWYEDGNGKHWCIVNYVVTNTSDAEISISEIGVFSPLAGYYNTGIPGTVVPVLMDRTVTTEPVTIAPTESKMITYKFTFNQTVA